MANKEQISEEQIILQELVKSRYWPVMVSVLEKRITALSLATLECDEVSLRKLQGGCAELKLLKNKIETLGKPKKEIEKESPVNTTAPDYSTWNGETYVIK